MDSEAYMILAVRNVYPSICRVRGSTDGFEADDTFIRMDASLLTTELKRLGSDIVWTVGETLLDWDIQQYAKNRREAYPKIPEQFDLLWHAIDEGTLDKTSDFYIKLKKVKDHYPKPA